MVFGTGSLQGCWSPCECQRETELESRAGRAAVAEAWMEDESLGFSS